MPRITNKRPLAGVLAVAMIAISIQWAGTRHGIGISPDSVKYVRYAKMLLKIEPPPLAGVTRDFLVHYPPLYPAILAAIGRDHFDIYTVMRFLQTGLLGLNVALVALIAWWLSPRSKAWVISPVLFIVLPPTFVVHLWGWSEPLFMLATLAGLASINKAAESGKARWVVMAATFAGLSVLARYAGIVLILCGTLMVGKTRRPKAEYPQNASEVWKRVLFFTLSTVPISLFLLRNMLIAGKATNRSFNSRGVLWERIGEGLMTFHNWVFPFTFGTRWDMLLGGVVFMAIVLTPLLMFLAMKPDGCDADETNNRKRHWCVCTVVYQTLYLLLILCDVKFIDSSTPFDLRILAPIVLPLLITVSLLMTGKEGCMSSQLKLNVIRVTIVVSAALAAFITGRTVIESATHGLGFHAERWRTSATLEHLAAQPLVKGQFLFSNEPDAIYTITGRTASTLAGFTKSTDSTQQTEAQHKIITERGIIVYLLHGVSMRDPKTTATLTQIKNRFSVEVTQRFKDGLVLQPLALPHPASLEIPTTTNAVKSRKDVNAD